MMARRGRQAFRLRIPFFGQPPLNPIPATVTDVGDAPLHLHLDLSQFTGQVVGDAPAPPVYEEPTPRPLAHKCFLPNDMILSTAMNHAHGLLYEQETGRRYRHCWCPRGGDHPAVLRPMTDAEHAARYAALPTIRKHPHPFTSALLSSDDEGWSPADAAASMVEEHIAKTARQLKAARDALLVLTGTVLTYNAETAAKAGAVNTYWHDGDIIYPTPAERVAYATYILKTEGGF